MRHGCGVSGFPPRRATRGRRSRWARVTLISWLVIPKWRTPLTGSFKSTRASRERVEVKHMVQDQMTGWRWWARRLGDTPTIQYVDIVRPEMPEGAARIEYLTAAEIARLRGE